jgi:RNA polymerase sigma factor (sigma-70 family)
MSVAATTQGMGIALRLTSDPPEPYEVKDATYSLAAARAQKHREWVAQIYEEYYERMLRYVSQRVSDYEEARDIVQDCFMSFFEKAAVETTLNPRAWMFRACKWQLRVFFAAYARRKAQLFGDFTGRNGPCLRSKTQRPEEIAQYRELRKGVEDQLLTFTEVQRERLQLRVFEDMESGEIGKAAGMTKEAAWTSIYRGLAQLRRRFAEQNPKNKPFKLRTTNGGHYRMEYDLWCVDLNRKFENVRAAADFACVTKNTIHCATSGKIATAGGHKWEWRERPAGDRRDFSPAQKAYWSRFQNKRSAAAAG